MNNYFFEAYNEYNGDSIGFVHIRSNSDIPKIISNLIFGKYKEDILSLNIKYELAAHFHDVIDAIQNEINNFNILNEHIGIRLSNEYSYRQYNKKYDNECKFVEYIVKEQNKEDKETIITKEILLESGFKDITKDDMKKAWEEYLKIDEYCGFMYITNDKDPIKIDIANGPTNNGSLWHVHLDNADCESIGSADISTIWQFNTLLSIFNSKFRL